MDMDGKLCIIPKDQMKTIIGHSPDFMDMLMMRAYGDTKQKKSKSKPKTKEEMGFF
jgi:hypothetical protein